MPGNTAHLFPIPKRDDPSRRQTPVSRAISEIYSRRKARENVIVRRQVAERAERLALVLNLLGQGERVAVGLLTWSGLIKRRYAGCRVYHVGRECGIEGNHVHEHATFEPGGVVGVDIGVLNLRSGQVEPETKGAIQRVVYAIEPSRIPLESAVQDHAFLVEIVERGPVLGFGSAASEGEVVLKGGSATGDLTLPVGVGGAEGRGGRDGAFRNPVRNE